MYTNIHWRLSQSIIGNPIHQAIFLGTKEGFEHCSPHGMLFPTGIYMFLCGCGSKPCTLVNIKIAGKWMFIPLELIIIGFDPPPCHSPHVIICMGICFTN